MQQSMNSTRLSARLIHLRARAFHLWFRFVRPVTLGVQGMVLDGNGQVFLVRHSYVPGWHFPGGGVEAGENALEALARELREEGNLVVDTRPPLHGVFFNNAYSRRDHILLFVVREFHQTAPRLPDREIAECGFFPLDHLPDGLSRAARARLAEVLDGAAVAANW